MPYRVHVEHDFLRDRLAVHIGHTRADDLYVAQPTDILFQSVDPAVAHPPALRIDPDLARVLYDALGRALGIHTPDARLAAEVLDREQQRVDKLIDHLTVSGDR